MKTYLKLTALLTILCWSQASMAQQFPQRPVRVIVPFAAGGLVDTLARTIGSQFQASTGQPMVVDTRPGGSSIIGMTACAKAPPDGYTLCFTVADSLSYNAALFSDLPYAPDSDFTPILNLAWSNTNLIVANAKAPYNSFRELIAYAKANPGKVNWATWGPASLPDVYLRWINRVASTDMTAIPYKGAGAGNPAVLSGEADVTYMGFGLAGPLMKSGKLKALISLGERRSSYVPELPSLAEEGADPGLKTYFAAFAPARTPVAVANRVNEILTSSINSPKIQDFYKTFALEFIDNTPEQFASFARQDRENALRVFRTIGIKPSSSPTQ